MKRWGVVELGIGGVVVFSVLAVLFKMKISTFTMARGPILESAGPARVGLRNSVRFAHAGPGVALDLESSSMRRMLEVFTSGTNLGVVFRGSIPGSGGVALSLIGIPLGSTFGLILRISRLACCVRGGAVVITGTGSTGSLACSERAVASLPMGRLSTTLVTGFLGGGVFGRGLPKLSANSVMAAGPLSGRLLVFNAGGSMLVTRGVLSGFSGGPGSAAFVLGRAAPGRVTSLVYGVLMPAAFNSGDNKANNTDSVFGKGVANKTKKVDKNSSKNSSTVGLNRNFMTYRVGGSIGTKGFSSFPARSLAISCCPRVNAVGIVNNGSGRVRAVERFMRRRSGGRLVTCLRVTVIRSDRGNSGRLAGR